MDKKKDQSLKEKEALKAKREKERRAKEKKKAADKHAKVIAADKAKKQRKKEKAKLQKEKKKEQLVKEKAKAEKKVNTVSVETIQTEEHKKLKKPTGNKKNGKQNNVEKPVITKPVTVQENVEAPPEKKVPVTFTEDITEKITVEIEPRVTKKTKEPKKTEAKTIKSKKEPHKSKAKSFFKSVGYTVNEKALKKIAVFFKKAFGAKYRFISIGVIAAVLIGTAVPVSILSYRGWLISTVAEGYNYYGITDSRARDIEISDDEQLERAEKMKRHGQKKAFDFFSGMNIVFNKWYSDGKLIFGSVAQNNCDLVVTIFDEDGEKVLYRSEGVMPGYYLPEIHLFEQLAPGEYKCRMFVAGYDSGNTLVGVQYINIKLTVGGE